MKLIDTYIIRQLFGPFLFFLLVFAGILWLNQALKIVDVVIDNGQPGMVFVELSAYLLARVVDSVFPVAAFASALYVTNKLYTESEYVVMMAAGQSPLQFARPFIFFGVILFVLVSVLSHFMTPISNFAFHKRQYEIRQQYLAQLIKAGEFISPKKGVTFYFGSVADDGTLTDVLIRETGTDLQVIHSAPLGKVIEQDNEVKLLLIDGLVEQFNPDSKLLNVVKFDSFSYDLTQFSKDLGPLQQSAAQTITPNLPWSIKTATHDAREAAIDAQSRLVRGLFCIIMPLLGAAILFSGSFSRGGFMLRIIFAIAILLGLNTLRGASESFVSKQPDLWWVLYSPIILSVFITCLLLLITTKGWNQRKLRLFTKKKQVIL